MTHEGVFLILLFSSSFLQGTGGGFFEEALGKFLRFVTTPVDATRKQLDAAAISLTLDKVHNHGSTEAQSTRHTAVSASGLMVITPEPSSRDRFL